MITLLVIPKPDMQKTHIAHNESQRFEQYGAGRILAAWCQHCHLTHSGAGFSATTPHKTYPPLKELGTEDQLSSLCRTCPPTQVCVRSSLSRIKSKSTSPVQGDWKWPLRVSVALGFPSGWDFWTSLVLTGQRQHPIFHIPWGIIS